MGDNVFMKTNLSTHGAAAVAASLGGFLEAIGPEARLKILLSIGQGEACVCHLEALLGLRQAYISQQLMALREAGVITGRREGRYVFYRLADLKVLELLRLAWKIQGGSDHAFGWRQDRKLPPCKCPGCTGSAASAKSRD